tara:strand:+ start:900 stop:1082 length:183 start_codon:yes stop_codon:yes gene_type:complete
MCIDKIIYTTTENKMKKSEIIKFLKTVDIQKGLSKSELAYLLKLINIDPLDVIHNKNNGE